MPRVILTLVLLTMAGSHAMAQEEFVGPASVGSSEPLFSYDDLERWKHGYLQIMPYYGGYHSFRPYNYKQVISQSQTAAGWGLSPDDAVLPAVLASLRAAGRPWSAVLSEHPAPAVEPDYGVVLQPRAGRTVAAPPTFDAPQFVAPQVSGPQFQTPGATAPAGVSPATFQQPQFSAPQFRAPAPAKSRPSQLQQYLQQR